MILNETQQKWANIITEEYGVKDPKKLSWMSQYAQNHEIYEGAQNPANNVSQGIYATPLNTMGMGDPKMPSDAGLAGGKFGSQIVGSGDVPMSTLTMALEVAAVTIGLELVPVIPANGPWAMLSYMDTPYAGGKYDAIGNLTSLDGKGPGAENKPIYVKVPATFAADWTKVKALQPLSADVKVGALNGKYIGISRIDGAVILQVESVDENASIADAMKAATSLVVTVPNPNKEVTTPLAEYTSTAWTAGTVKAELVATAADHVQGFTNFFDGKDDPMSRAENETGTGNTIGARMFTKLVQMGSYEVTGTVTRQQLQDMPLYGIDVIGKVLESMQNQISQAINNRILDRVFKLGVDNAAMQYRIQNVDLNLYLNGVNGSGKPLSEFDAYSKYVGMDGKNPAYFAGRVVPNSIQNTAAENVTTHQRRIMSRILAAANLIANVSRDRKSVV